jgi:hypothetical protein
MIMSNLSNDYAFLLKVVATPVEMTGNDNKVVILNFDDGRTVNIQTPNPYQCCPFNDTTESL